MILFIKNQCCSFKRQSA